jgi:hypothetical protein
MSETIYFGTDEIRMSAGKFRTTRRYIRAATTSPVFAIAQSKTLDVVYGSSFALARFRYSVNGYVINYTTDATSSSFAATVEEVKI